MLLSVDAPVGFIVVNAHSSSPSGQSLKLSRTHGNGMQTLEIGQMNTLGPPQAVVGRAETNLRD